MRTLLANGQTETAIRALERMAVVAPDHEARRQVQEMRRQLEARD